MKVLPAVHRFDFGSDEKSGWGWHNLIELSEVATELTWTNHNDTMSADDLIARSTGLNGYKQYYHDYEVPCLHVAPHQESQPMFFLRTQYETGDGRFHHVNAINPYYFVPAKWGNLVMKAIQLGAYDVLWGWKTDKTKRVYPNTLWEVYGRGWNRSHFDSYENLVDLSSLGVPLYQPGRKSAHTPSGIAANKR